ncbi:imidazole glycerol phosphate synthase subunit HisH [Halobellus salinus]|uniref:Imidazole glycerol phosphate synthase subunit HisH n=1 Tax=Halobellus salinus TaxID=931585 RepID=A0A830EDL1_9EURY|nr:imidazole glycerol phosphate synthase subunit HisH [Halobellus salinus]GGI94812.1 imidazole glycerol phosphate synthase subunit HisH [Halobellus salinus]SMP20314.1 imidazole glycerol phosphate synthase subunit hisH [Halobellus salinus]
MSAQTAADVVLVDYGLGNLRSAQRGLERAGAAVSITDDPAQFAAADGIVLPGVGAFSEGMENAGPFREPLAAAADRGQPVFGICLGMQMLLTTSEEADHAGQGEVEGLDFVPGTNLRFDTGVKVPHMGWNELDIEHEHPIVSGVDSVGSEIPLADGTTTGGSVDGDYAYFVHSYYADPADPDSIVATTDYGTDFPAVIANEAGNVFGTQFHPEKSGETGLRILRNFVEYCADR